MIDKIFPQGLYRRLATLSVLIAFSIGLLLSLYQIYNDYRQQDERLEEELTDLVQVVKSSASKAIYEFDEKLGQIVIEGLFDHPTVLEVTLFDDYNDVFLTEKRREASDRPAWLPDNLAFQARELTFPLIISSASSDNHSSQIVMHIDPYLATSDFISRAWLIIITGILRNTFITFALLLLCYHLITKPINQLNNNLAEIDPLSDDDKRLPLLKQKKSNELTSLTNLVNILLDKIQKGLLSIRNLNKELNVEISERIKIENAINYAEQQTAGATGIEYIKTLVTFLSRSLKIDGAIVATLDEQDGVSGLESMAIFYDGEKKEAPFIPLSKLPFRENIEKYNQEKEFCIISKEEAKQASILYHQNALGLPLFSHSEKLNSILLLINSEPFSEQFYLKHKSLLQIFGSRIITEIERDKQQQTIHYLAHTDPLTKLGNRHSFQKLLENTLPSITNIGAQLALLYLDLDRFKWVNDSFGHEVGDKLLKQAASRLKKAIGPNDLLFRIGGDEFALVTQIDNLGEEKILAQGVLNAFKEPFSINNHLIVIKSSIGISVYPSSASSSQELIKNADIAMYLAKKETAQPIQYFSKELDSQLQRKIQIENALSKAISQSQLDIAYQPQFDLRDGHLCGVEALVRWSDEKLGRMSPAEFIPIAEETGLIHKLGQWVTEQVCIQTASWNNALNKPLTVAINFSAAQLRNPVLVPNLLNTIAQSGANPKHLELEITETSLIEDFAVTASILKRLAESGLNISIDDFGTGYSSLKYLKSLPINSLKIDQEFVAGVPQSHSDTNIVRAVIALAKAMNMQVVAEGVETSDQADFLYAQGCDYAQGFYYSKPVSAQQITKLLSADYRASTPGYTGGVA